jgi:hypothetical protein
VLRALRGEPLATVGVRSASGGSDASTRDSGSGDGTSYATNIAKQEIKIGDVKMKAADKRREKEIARVAACEAAEEAAVDAGMRR